MEMSFRKLPENQHEIVVRDRKGPDVRLPAVRQTGAATIAGTIGRSISVR